MFQVKDFPSIVASKIAHMRSTQRKITDFSVGSVARTLVEAPAIEIDEFYQRLLFGLLEAIPVAVFDAFGFEALAATPASGTVHFKLDVLRADPVPIPVGTIVKVGADNRRFQTVGAAVIAPGDQAVDVRVIAEFPGRPGNAAVGEIDTLVSYLPAHVTVINTLPVAGGRDAESVEDRKSRFISYVGSLSRGTLFACEYAARSTMLYNADGIPVEHVTHVGITELPGQVDMFIYSSASMPSAELLSKITDVINGYRSGSSVVPGYRPIGVEVNVHPMTERKIDIAMHAWSVSGGSPGIVAENAVRDALARAIFATEPGGTLYIDQISDAVLSVRELQRVTIGLRENIVAGKNQVLLLGNLDITWVT